MSRIGKKPVPLPEGVEVNVEKDNLVTIKGPRGELTKKIPSCLEIVFEEGQMLVQRPSDRKEHRAMHGLGRSLLANMVEGVTNGYVRELELVGVGYRAAKQGDNLVLNVGYSQPVQFIPVEGIELDVPAATRITVKGIDKEVVGDTAAKIRRVRPPEPYKGKGIKYAGEYVRRKVGKAGK